MSIWVGIDPGTDTGFAVWNDLSKQFDDISTLPIHEALQRVAILAEKNDNICVIFEDARLRKWYGTHTAKEDRDKLIGAGSIRRDSTIWEDALTDWGIEFRKVAPKNNMTKLHPDYFARLTGYRKRTSEHGRDAAMLVYGR